MSIGHVVLQGIDSFWTQHSNTRFELSVLLNFAPFVCRQHKPSDVHITAAVSCDKLIIYLWPRRRTQICQMAAQ